MIPIKFQRWIAALRSGHYTQGMEYLRTPNGYSALGVLCDISGLGNWRVAAEYPGEPVFRYVSVENQSDVSLPPEVVQWMNFNSPKGALRFSCIRGHPVPSTIYPTIAAMNDGWTNDDGVRHPPLTFQQIAETIIRDWSNLTKER